jgi:predicted nuclease with TOPRIM domain
MKKLIFLLLFLPFFVACNSGDKAKLEQLQKENQQLLGEQNKKDSTINDFLESINSIEENLSTVKAKENLISESTKNNNEIKIDTREKINQDIQEINNLMEKNKKLISSLRGKLKKSELKIAELQVLIENMTKQLADRDAEISTLKEELVKLNFAIEVLNKKVDSVSVDNQNKNVVINKQTEDLNTAYYVLGTSKELKEHNVITKEGGFIGLGKTKKLKGDFDQNYFTKVDISKINSININSKKAKVLTSHPAGSYKLEKEGKVFTKLVITNSAEFWKASKYLVIVLD